MGWAATSDGQSSRASSRRRFRRIRRRTWGARGRFGAGAHRARVRGRTAAARVARRVDRQLPGDVPHPAVPSVVGIGSRRCGCPLQRDDDQRSCCRSRSPRSLLQSAPGITITGARIVDGTGSAPRIGSVRVEGDRIVAVGNVKPGAGDVIVDAKGLVLAPGFIDIHNHSTSGLTAEPRGGDAGRAGDHDDCRRRGRLVAVADRRLSRAAARRTRPR